MPWRWWWAGRVNHETWIHTVATTWHTNHPHQPVNHLHQLIADVAAWRERHDHTGPDPLGPTPAPNAHGFDTHKRLEQRISQTQGTLRIEIPH